MLADKDLAYIKPKPGDNAPDSVVFLYNNVIGKDWIFIY